MCSYVCYYICVGFYCKAMQYCLLLVTDKQTRVCIGDQNKLILEDLYQKGMISTSASNTLSSSLIEQAVEGTQLDRKIVMVLL